MGGIGGMAGITKWKSLPFGAVGIAVGITVLAVRQLHFDGHGLAVAAEAQGHHASRRRFPDHAPQLFHAFHFCAVHGEDDIVLFEPGLARGRVLVHHGDFHALLFFQLEGAQAVGSDVSRVHAEIGTAAYVFAGDSENLASGIKRRFSAWAATDTSGKLSNVMKMMFRIWYLRSFLLVTAAAKGDVAGGRPNFEYRAAAVQVTLGVTVLGP